MVNINLSVYSPGKGEAWFIVAEIQGKEQTEEIIATDLHTGLDDALLNVADQLREYFKP